MDHGDSGYGDDVMSQVLILTPTETHTCESGYRFHAGVDAGGPIFTHGLPVMGPNHIFSLLPFLLFLPIQQVISPGWLFLQYSA